MSAASMVLFISLTVLFAFGWMTVGCIVYMVHETNGEDGQFICPEAGFWELLFSMLLWPMYLKRKRPDVYAKFKQSLSHFTIEGYCRNIWLVLVFTVAVIMGLAYAVLTWV